jgi:hypothetical protein
MQTVAHPTENAGERPRRPWRTENDHPCPKAVNHLFSKSQPRAHVWLIACDRWDHDGCVERRKAPPQMWRAEEHFRGEMYYEFVPYPVDRTDLFGRIRKRRFDRRHWGCPRPLPGHRCGADPVEAVSVETGWGFHILSSADISGPDGAPLEMAALTRSQAVQAFEWLLFSLGVVEVHWSRGWPSPRRNPESDHWAFPIFHPKRRELAWSLFRQRVAAETGVEIHTDATDLWLPGELPPETYKRWFEECVAEAERTYPRRSRRE